MDNKLMNDIKLNLRFLEQAIDGGYVNPYDVVENMSHELRGALEAALYAYSANMDHLTGGDE